MKKKLFLLGLIALIMSSATLTAQVTIGSRTVPHEDALLDLVETPADSSSTKGLLLPRVKLVSTADAAPMENHVNGMLVYNTATTAGSDSVTPGTYYNDGKKWVRVGSGTEWNIAGTASDAQTDKTSPISRAGSVSIYNGANPATASAVPSTVFEIINDNTNNDANDNLFISSYGTTPALQFNRYLGTRETPLPLNKGDEIAGIYFLTNSVRVSKINAFYQGNGTDNLSNLTFATSGTQKMVIDTIGRVGIGTTAPRSKLEVNGAITNATTFSAGTSNIIDFSISNIAYTTSAGPIVLQNIKTGGVYTLLVNVQTASRATISAEGFASRWSEDPDSATVNGWRVYTIKVINFMMLISVDVYHN